MGHWCVSIDDGLRDLASVKVYRKEVGNNYEGEASFALAVCGAAYEAARSESA